jgi:putative chitinase
VKRKAFYDQIRPTLFHGALSQTQVDGFEVILDAWDGLLEIDTWPDVDARWIAYCLATAYHETGRTMQPVREVGMGRGRPYGVPDPENGNVYYGRGFVQLTWRRNYARQQERLGIPLVARPDLALEPRTAARVLLRGMADGDFTGRRLGDFFTPEREDAVGARAIVNGTDMAERIAAVYYDMRDALGAALDAH